MAITQPYIIVGFSATPDLDFITQFADQIQMPLHNSQLIILERLRQRYICKLKFGPDFKRMISLYVLKEDLPSAHNSHADRAMT